MLDMGDRKSALLALTLLVPAASIGIIAALYIAPGGWGTNTLSLLSTLVAGFSDRVVCFCRSQKAAFIRSQAPRIAGWSYLGNIHVCGNSGYL